LSDGDSGKAFCVNRFYHTARFERTAKNFETGLAKNFSKVHKFHRKTAIRFIAPIAINGFPVRESVKRVLDLDVVRGLEDRSEHSFGYRKNVLWRYE
jgi:hypothetical protein